VTTYSKGMIPEVAAIRDGGRQNLTPADSRL
jgi:hypothetical protein